MLDRLDTGDVDLGFDDNISLRRDSMDFICLWRTNRLLHLAYCTWLSPNGSSETHLVWHSDKCIIGSIFGLAGFRLELTDFSLPRPASLGS